MESGSGSLVVRSLIRGRKAPLPHRRPGFVKGLEDSELEGISGRGFIQAMRLPGRTAYPRKLPFFLALLRSSG